MESCVKWCSPRVGIWTVIFAGHMDSRIEGFLSKFADDTELCGAANTLEGKEGILDKLERQVSANHTKFKVKS